MTGEINHRVSRAATAFINYSWQAKPTVLEDPHPYPSQHHRGRRCRPA